MAKDYPLVLTTGGRTNIYEQSQLRWVPKLRALFPDPLIEINPEDARKYGLEDGDLVDIVSPRGRAKMKAKVTDDMMPGVIHAYHGWPGEGNINLVTPDKPADPVTGGAALTSSLCRVESLHKR